jgi:hypothetical protein
VAFNFPKSQLPISPHQLQHWFGTSKPTLIAELAKANTALALEVLSLFGNQRML